MALKNSNKKKNEKYREIILKLVPVDEISSEFQVRREAVQIMITDMIINSKKRGRPKMDREELKDAA